MKDKQKIKDLVVQLLDLILEEDVAKFEEKMTKPNDTTEVLSQEVSQETANDVKEIEIEIKQEVSPSMSIQDRIAKAMELLKGGK